MFQIILFSIFVLRLNLFTEIIEKEKSFIQYQFDFLIYIKQMNNFII